MAEAVVSPLETVKAALMDLTGDSVDELTMDYMIGMLDEEVGNGITGKTVFELVGPFLLDCGRASDDEEAQKLCDELAEKLSIETATTGSSANGNEGDGLNAKLSNPVMLGNMMETCHSGFADPFLGVQQRDVNFNSSTSIGESMRLHKAMQKERDKQVRLMREWEKQKVPPPPPRRKHGDSQLCKLIDTIVESFSVSVGGRELLKDSTLKLVVGRRYGLIGRNGIGKSTFLSALARHDIVGVKQDTSIGCVEQEITWGDETAIDAVLKVDVERSELLAEVIYLEKAEQTEASGKRLAWVYQRLDDIDACNAESQAAIILSGLGFSEEMQRQSVKSLSGGWRMRVALSRALFSDPDILLLDEPTNHLDLHAVAWLSEYLQGFSKTVIIVSHARNFLNDVCTDMIHFADQKLTYYKGSYDQFEESRAERMLVQQRAADSQEARRKHVQQFIDKFRTHAKTAALVQSRIKALNKLPLLEVASKDPTLTFNFGEPEGIPTPVMQLTDCSFTYDDPNSPTARWILKDVSMSFDLESRVAICGVNGSGKSTLLTILTGQHEPTGGMCIRHNKLRIGFFSQHHVDQLDLNLNSVQQLQARYPESNLKDEDARNFLGKFGINGLLALEPLFILSGGQKSRVAIALVAFRNPHILVLDEPTNHLDLDAVQALISALNVFTGGVIVVSHDAHLLSCVVDDVWHVDPKTKSCKKFYSDFETYRKQLLKNKL